MAFDFQHIVSNPAVLGGKPCIRGTRISVEHLLELLASGATRADILQRYPHLSADQVEDAFRYASRFLHNEIIIEVDVAH